MRKTLTTDDLYPSRSNGIDHASAIRSVFFTHYPEVLASAKDGIAWTDGPLWLGDRLLFSDTIEGSLWAYSASAGLQRQLPDAGGCPGPSAALHDRVVATLHEERLRERHTYCPASMLAPGPNGNVLENSTGLIVSAQHGARRVVRRKASTLEITDVLSCSYGGLPLNGPNELAVHPRDGSIYFTDPFDGFLEIGKRPLGDHNYTSDKSALGFAGVYRVPPPPRVGAADAARPELVTAVLERPSGIGFEPAGTSAEGADDEHAMWVSECCQGHAESCPPATARWHRYVPVDGKPHANYTRERTVEWARPGGGGGCAGGFTLLARPQRSTLLVGACPLGVCVVDVERDDHAMVEYVEFPHRTTNVALAPGDHHLYVTGEGHLWRLPLAKDLFERPSHLPYLKEYKRVWQEAEQRWGATSFRPPDNVRARKLATGARDVVHDDL